MLSYKWPGNVRQLKNITEQMSVLSQKRVIDAEELKKYITLDPESTQLATISQPGQQHSYESEREILYKILYELRGNVADLRREVNGLRKQMDDARQLGDAAFSHNYIDAQQSKVPALRQDRGVEPYEQQPRAEEAVAEEIKTEPASLNLNDLGRQMVEKALERNGGNRKKAAQELGISDRTLYRRIKQYGLDKK